MSGREATPTKAYHHGDLREALIAAALQQVQTAGYESLSVAALSKTLGVSHAACYRHFVSKDALLAVVAARAFAVFAQVLGAAVAGLPPGERLSANARAYVAFGRERPGLYQMMFGSRILAEAAPDSEVAAAARGSFDLLLDALQASRPATDAVREAVGIWSGLHGLVQLDSFHLLSGARLQGIPIGTLIEDVVHRHGPRWRRSSDACSR